MRQGRMGTDEALGGSGRMAIKAVRSRADRMVRILTVGDKGVLTTETRTKPILCIFHWRVMQAVWLAVARQDDLQC